MDIGSMMKTFLELQRQQAELDKNKTVVNEAVTNQEGSPSIIEENGDEDSTTNLTERNLAGWPGSHGNISLALPSIPAQGLIPGIGYPPPHTSEHSNKIIETPTGDYEEEWDYQLTKLLTNTEHPYKIELKPIDNSLQDQGTWRDLILSFLTDLKLPEMAKGLDVRLINTTFEKLLLNLIGYPDNRIHQQMTLPAIVRQLYGRDIVKRMSEHDGRVCIIFVIIHGDEIAVTNKNITDEDNEMVESNLGKRKIGIELMQDQSPSVLGDNVKEDLSGGGGIEYGKHEGGGVSLKLDIDTHDNVKEKRGHKYLDRNKRQDMMNLFFTW